MPAAARMRPGGAPEKGAVELSRKLLLVSLLLLLEQLLLDKALDKIR